MLDWVRFSTRLFPNMPRPDRLPDIITHFACLRRNANLRNEHSHFAYQKAIDVLRVILGEGVAAQGVLVARELSA